MWPYMSHTSFCSMCFSQVFVRVPGGVFRQLFPAHGGSARLTSPACSQVPAAPSVASSSYRAVISPPGASQVCSVLNESIMCVSNDSVIGGHPGVRRSYLMQLVARHRPSLAQASGNRRARSGRLRSRPHSSTGSGSRLCRTRRVQATAVGGCLNGSRRDVRL